jgi:hypothetical protein
MVAVAGACGTGDPPAAAVIPLDGPAAAGAPAPATDPVDAGARRGDRPNVARPSGASPAAASAGATAGTEPTDDTDERAGTEPEATATSPAPDRVLLLGDSLLWTQKDLLTAAFAEHGVETRFEGGSGTGPLTAQSRWIADLTRALVEFGPDAVVVEACCNYGASPDHPEYDFYLFDGSPVAADSDTMFELWADATAEIVRRAEAAGVAVWWVITPPVDTASPIHDRIERINRIARQMADDWPGLRYIDWTSAVTTPSGRLLDPVVADDGSESPLRVDGVHFSRAGLALLTEVTVGAVVGGPAAFPGSAPTA